MECGVIVRSPTSSGKCVGEPDKECGSQVPNQLATLELAVGEPDWECGSQHCTLHIANNVLLIALHCGCRQSIMHCTLRMHITHCTL